ncbi:hypothetical protein SBA4_780006 [Candidatus Sulfopaludibacter sp. SbA4]|nr:hypothetical protein SBA4_780006 [Candidatus Sulfopaludibacter sp. SbA4]
MEAYVDDSVAPHRFNLMLLGIFAAVAIVLAAAGVYGVMARWLMWRVSARAAARPITTPPKAKAIPRCSGSSRTIPSCSPPPLSYCCGRRTFRPVGLLASAPWPRCATIS